MSVDCRPVLTGPFTYDATCDCTLASFDFTITGLCNGAKYGILLGVFHGNSLVGTVCDIFVVGEDAANCSCVDVTRHYNNVILDVPCCDGNDLPWDVRPLAANYIYRCQP